jgi:hypothetical protein
VEAKGQLARGREDKKRVFFFFCVLAMDDGDDGGLVCCVTVCFRKRKKERFFSLEFERERERGGVRYLERERGGGRINMDGYSGRQRYLKKRGEKLIMDK